MKIKKIRLNKYKRFHSLTIDLGENPKRIIALVGPNGCGKSSVFDGMLFHHAAHVSMVGNKGQKDFRFHSIEQSPTYNYENIQIEFDEGSYDSIRARKGAIGKENTIFSFRSPYRYNSNLKITSTHAVEELRLNHYGASLSSDIDDKMEENYRRLNIKYNRFLTSQDCKPSEAKRHIIGELNQAIRRCLELEITSLGDIEDNKGTLYFTKADYTGAEFEYNVLSAGEKEVVDILLDLYLRQEEYDDTIFIIDEPELHVNTAIQRKFLVEINRLIGDNCQLWVATHSIGFLRALQEELKDQCQIIEFKAEIPWASTEQTLYPLIISRSNWQRILKTALDDLTGLVSPKRIVYCEGKDNPGKGGLERGMDAQVFNIIFGEKYPDTLFVSSGGNTELDQRSQIAFAILSKVFPDLEIWVCKDRDMSSGILNNEDDRQQYLRLNSNNHRVIKRWELENYLYDKSVLKKFCEANGSDFSEAEYDLFVTDIVNQHVKDETGRIKNFCNLRVSVNADKFKIELAKYITPDMNVYIELENCIFERK